VIKGADDCPFACSLLSGRVKYPGDERLSVGVPEPEYLTCYLDEIGIKLTLVPLIVDISHFIIGELSGADHQVVSFADQLHVTVLDPVMRHFNEVTGAVIAYPGDAGGAVSSTGCDGKENILYVGPGFP